MKTHTDFEIIGMYMNTVELNSAFTTAYIIYQETWQNSTMSSYILHLYKLGFFCLPM